MCKKAQHTHHTKIGNPFREGTTTHVTRNIRQNKAQHQKGANNSRAKWKTTPCHPFQDNDKTDPVALVPNGIYKYQSIKVNQNLPPIQKNTPKGKGVNIKKNYRRECKGLDETQTTTNDGQTRIS